MAKKKTRKIKSQLYYSGLLRTNSAQDSSTVHDGFAETKPFGIISDFCEPVWMSSKECPMSNFEVKKSDQLQDLHFFIDNILFDIGYSTVLFETSPTQFCPGLFNSAWWFCWDKTIGYYLGLLRTGLNVQQGMFNVQYQSEEIWSNTGSSLLHW